MKNVLGTERDVVVLDRMAWATIGFLWIGTIGASQAFTALLGSQSLIATDSRFTAIKGASILLAFAFALARINRLGVDRSVQPIVVVLAFAPWVFTVANDLLSSQEVNLVGLVVWPTTVLLALAAAPRRQVLLAVCVFSLSTVVAALAMGLFAPAAGTYRFDDPSRLEKPILPIGILEGGFSSGNNLGTFACLSLALSLGVLQRRKVATVVVLFVVVWSASRSAIVAALVALIVFSVASRVSAAGAGRLFKPALIGLAALALSVPFFAGPEQFTGRGRIWAAVFGDSREYVIFGHGSQYFANSAALGSGGLGRDAVQGHNIFVHSFALGGVLLAALILAILVVAIVGVSSMGTELVSSAIPYFAALLLVSTLEVPIGVLDRTDFSIVGLVPLMLFLMAGSRAHALRKPA